MAFTAEWWMLERREVTQSTLSFEDLKVREFGVPSP